MSLDSVIESDNLELARLRSVERRIKTEKCHAIGCALCDLKFGPKVENGCSLTKLKELVLKIELRKINRGDHSG